MLRSVTLGFVLSVLAAACALVEPLPSVGTVMVQAQVRNRTGGQVDLSVQTLIDDVVRGTAEPASLRAGSTTIVAFSVPSDDNWWIAVNGELSVPGNVAKEHFQRAGCLFQIELTADGPARWWCLGG